MKKSVGKQVLHRLYVHCSALDEIAVPMKVAIAKAEALAKLRRDIDYNVVRLDSARGEIALLSYPKFFAELFPALEQSWRVHLDSATVFYRDYRSSLNPPILHRKELMIPRGHPSRPQLEAATQLAEEIGLFDEPYRIGFRKQWQALLEQKGYAAQGDRLVPIGNATPDETDARVETHQTDRAVQRHLTALARRFISAPVQLLLRLGLLTTHTTLFDYGCGKGDDVAALTSRGLSAAGWDPYFAPDAPRAPAEIVNLGFVINVIEDRAERIAALQSAYQLCTGVLAVSVMLESPDKLKGQRYRDGFLSSRQTFQKYFTQAELQTFVETALDQDAVPVAPGVVLVFRNSLLEQRFHLQRRADPSRASRVLLYSCRQTNAEVSEVASNEVAIERARRTRAHSPHATLRHPKTPRAAPRARPAPTFSDEEAGALDSLWRHFLRLGRAPRTFEVDGADRITSVFGSWASAIRAAGLRGDADALRAARLSRIDELRVYFALDGFSRRRPFGALDPSLQEDIRTFFGSLTAAQGAGRALLDDCADASLIEAACKQAASLGLGWLHQDHSLQLHTSLVARLPPVLQAYVGCATALYGDVSSADLVKIHIKSGKVSLMRFDDFSGKAVPLMVERAKVKLREQDLEMYEYGSKFPSPVLLYKSRYINEEFDGYPAQADFDRALERLGILAPDELGPPWAEFQRRLAAVRRRIEGTALVGAADLPDIDDQCGRFFTYRQLIECGETWQKVRVENTPKRAASFNALFELATTVLDPVVDYFGMVRITYGLASPALTRLIPRGIAPKLDQHASCEHSSSGALICPRLGAAVDFVVEDEDMALVANWIIDQCDFDRLYFYGRNRPIHVSVSATPQREVYEVPERGGRRMPPRRVDHVSGATSPLSR